MASGLSKVQIEVVNPVAEIAPPEAVTPVSRLDTLDGKKICLWWNSKSQGDIALNTVAGKLSERYPGLEFVYFSQQYDHGRNFPERYDEVKKSGCDAVIATTAD